MSRNLLELSYAWHGIPPQYLEELDEQDIVTMWDILDDIRDARKDAEKGRG